MPSAPASFSFLTNVTLLFFFTCEIKVTVLSAKNHTEVTKGQDFPCRLPTVARKQRHSVQLNVDFRHKGSQRTHSLPLEWRKHTFSATPDPHTTHTTLSGHRMSRSLPKQERPEKGVHTHTSMHPLGLSHQQQPSKAIHGLRDRFPPQIPFSREGKPPTHLPGRPRRGPPPTPPAKEAHPGLGGEGREGGGSPRPRFPPWDCWPCASGCCPG